MSPTSFDSKSVFLNNKQSLQNHVSKTRHCLFTKTSFTARGKLTPRILFQKLIVLMNISDPIKKILIESTGNMVKTRQNEKVNKGRSATWVSNFANFNGSKFVFHKALKHPKYDQSCRFSQKNTIYI